MDRRQGALMRHTSARPEQRPPVGITEEMLARMLHWTNPMAKTTCLLVAAVALGGCFRAHGIGDDDGPPVLRDRDAGRPGDPGRDLGPVVVDPPPSTCGAPDGLPESPECVGLCQDVCERFAACGGDAEACLEGCYAAYRCPGETPGHDTAICMGARPDGGCEAVCDWVPTFGGFARTGPNCPLTGPPTGTPCGDRAYCDCVGECAPLIDLTTGCVCPCDDPFNCEGIPCDCDCGGATYLGCAAVGQCMETEIACDPASERGRISLGDGCPVCAPR